jgi:hypothetical protein
MRALLLGVCWCFVSCHTTKKDTTPTTLEAPTTQSAPQTPNRFDSLAWPEITTSDKFFLASRVAPTFLEAIESQQITMPMLSDPTPPKSLEVFLSVGLPAPSEETISISSNNLAGLARLALSQGSSSEQWKALEAAANAQQKSVQLAPLYPPGDIQIEGNKITVRFQMSDGFEWFSYLVCKGALRGNEELRLAFLGETKSSTYAWTPGEEELCLWSLIGTREHIKTQADMGRTPSPDPSLVRLDEAAQKGHVLGFVMVEFLLPRRGSLAGISTKQMDAAVDYLLSEAVVKQGTGNRE